jgi:hypothetical protein
MPSIPQSLLWISLVVLWLFVLVPMLASKREAVRRTSDVALATRVLNRDIGARLLKRAGPAAGHRSDPNWHREDDGHEEFDDELSEDSGGEDLREHSAEDSAEGSGEEQLPDSGSTVFAAAAGERTEPNYLDVDVVDEDSGVAPVGGTAEAGDPGDVQPPEPEAGVDEADEYEYVEDSSGLEAEEEPAATIPPVAATTASRRRRYDSKTAAAVIARKYQFRKRVLTMMALILVVSAAAAFAATSTGWWVCGGAGGVTLFYLAYLRRQTRIEQQVRARRMRRMARSRLGVENTSDREFDVVPSRLRRPGSVVLEIDDEDPVFEHLDYLPFARHHDWRHDLPRAAGQ